MKEENTDELELTGDELIYSECKINFHNITSAICIILFMAFYTFYIELNLIEKGSTTYNLYIFRYLIISVIIALYASKSTINYFFVKYFGKEEIATVKKYINGSEKEHVGTMQTVILSLDESDGNTFIKYELKIPRRPYEINSKVKIKKYKDKLYIVKDYKRNNKLNSDNDKQNRNEITYCQNCGALATNNICSYCKGTSGIEKNYIKLEYPIIECKEVIIDYQKMFYFIFEFIWKVLLGAFVISLYFKADSMPLSLLGSLLCTLSLIPLYKAFIPIIRSIILLFKGKKIEAIVYGYMDDKYIKNGKPTYIVKLLINTNRGKRFILYQLKDIKQPFKINEKIILKKYKNIFKIKKQKKYYFE